MFFTDWLVLTVFICLILYLTVMLLYYKTLLSKEKTSKDFIKNNLDDTEIIIRKLQIQLQRSLGNIDIVTEELKELEANIEALL